MGPDVITPEELAQIDLDIKRAEMLKSLKKNKTYKALIDDLFVEQGIENLVVNMSHKTDEEFRTSMNEQLLARSYFKRFMKMIEQQGVEAEEYYKSINSEEV